MAAKSKEETKTALATAGAAAMVIVDELDGIMPSEGYDDGLGEVDHSDIKIGALVFNMKGMDGAGDPIPPNVYFNTLEETTKKTVRLVFLQMHKSRVYATFNSEKDETERHCASYDRVTGTMADGTERPCKGCPHIEWRNEGGKRTRDCAEVVNMLGVDYDTQTPVMTRFKKTSHRSIMDYLNKHHIGKRMVPVKGPDGVVRQKRANMPLFSFVCNASLEMAEGGKYAIPKLERGEMLPREQIVAFAAESENAREYMQRAIDVTEKQADAVEEAGEGDGSFNPDEFAGKGSNDFVETTGSAA